MLRVLIAMNTRNMVKTGLSEALLKVVINN